jgi:hypothetical protein
MDASALLELIIAQNDFILSLWITFMTAHFAIIAGLLSHKQPIPWSLGVILSFIAYPSGLYINGNSLIDAYSLLNSLQKDFVALIPKDNKSELLFHSKDYIDDFLSYPKHRAEKMWFLYSVAGLWTVLGYWGHYFYYKEYNFMKTLVGKLS